MTTPSLKKDRGESLWNALKALSSYSKLQKAMLCSLEGCIKHTRWAVYAVKLDSGGVQAVRLISTGIFFQPYPRSSHIKLSFHWLRLLQDFNTPGISSTIHIAFH